MDCQLVHPAGPSSGRLTPQVTSSPYNSSRLVNGQRHPYPTLENSQPNGPPHVVLQSSPRNSTTTQLPPPTTGSTSNSNCLSTRIRFNYRPTSGDCPLDHGSVTCRLNYSSRSPSPLQPTSFSVPLPEVLNATTKTTEKFHTSQPNHFSCATDTSRSLNLSCSSTIPPTRSPTGNMGRRPPSPTTTTSNIP
jgi:hypothetical protein